MPKFIIEWDAGYGPQNEIVETADRAQAEKMAEEAWRDEAESAAQYGAEEYSKQRALDLGLENEEDFEEETETEEETKS